MSGLIVKRSLIQAAAPLAGIAHLLAQTPQLARSEAVLTHPPEQQASEPPPQSSFRTQPVMHFH